MEGENRRRRDCNYIAITVRLFENSAACSFPRSQAVPTGSGSAVSQPRGLGVSPVWLKKLFILVAFECLTLAGGGYRRRYVYSCRAHDKWLTCFPQCVLLAER